MSSSVVSAMRFLAKASRVIPSLTFHFPFAFTVIGNPKVRPSGTPYSPRLVTATDAQSPAAVAVVRLTTVSIAALAAEAAELAPRASMIAAPRFWTVVMNSPRSHLRSPITSGTRCLPIVALAKSGNCVDE